MTTRDKAHVVGEKAERLMKELLGEDRWIFRAQIPDYGIDFHVEYTTEERETSGLVAAVQVKGETSPKVANGKVKFDMDVDHLKYYRDKVRNAVFLFVVDVPSQCGWYLFVQKYLEEDCANKQWRRQKTLRLMIPRDNVLNTDRFLSDLKDADSYMRNLWPGSVEAAVAHETAELEALDDRFGVTVIAKSHGPKSYVISARDPSSKPPVNFKITAPGLDTSAVRDLFEFGAPTELKGVTLTVDGSRLIEKIQGSPSATGTVKIVPNKRPEVAIILKPCTAGEGVPNLMLHGTAFGGSRGVLIKSSGNNCPLEVEVRLRINSTEAHNSRVTLNFNLEPWHNKKVIALPFVVPLHALAQMAIHGCGIDIHVESEGHPLLAGTLSSDLTVRFDGVWRFLNLAGIVENLCRRLDADLSFDELKELGESELDNAVRLYELWETGRHKLARRQYPNVSISCGFTGITQGHALDGDVTVHCDFSQQELQIFNRKVLLNGLRRTLSGFRFSDESRSAIRRAHAGDVLKLKLLRTESSEVVDEVDPERIIVQS